MIKAKLKKQIKVVEVKGSTRYALNEKAKKIAKALEARGYQINFNIKDQLIKYLHISSSNNKILYWRDLGYTVYFYY